MARAGSSRVTNWPEKISAFLHAGKIEKEKKIEKKPSRNSLSDSYRYLETKTTATSSLCTVKFWGTHLLFLFQLRQKQGLFSDLY